MEEVLERIPFADDTRQALITHAGPKGALLDAVVALEAGDVDRAEAIVGDAGDLYVFALESATRAADAMFDPGEARPVG